jgi:bifunctional UDP-N-acetylglucosamine pyrophosphorylase / glucosamine-1-phosphate N-acetyltransferase
MTPLAAVVMAAGLGTRMKSEVPKHLHPLLGRRMLDWALEALRGLGLERIVVVCSPDTRELMAASLPEDVEVAVQAVPRGTGDAVVAARGALAGFDGDVLVVPGDSPLVTTELLSVLAVAQRVDRAAVTMLSVETERPLPYGRIVRDGDGDVLRIVEERDATPEERAIRELNASFYVFSAPDLWWALERLDVDNAQGELYLTDTIEHLVRAGRPIAVATTRDVDSVHGVNTRADLAQAAAVLRARVLERHMLAGVTVVDPSTTWVEADVELEPDVVVNPYTTLRGGTRVAAGAQVGPHVVADGAEIGPGAIVGPFAYLRPGAVLAAGSKVGTFVEVKNSRIGERTKVPHLSYIGDAEIGEDTNIGAGAITANYRPERGAGKERTVIGRNVHTGSDNVFVAPVEIGDDAWIGAGSTITEDVPPGALAVARARQVVKENYADRERND